MKETYNSMNHRIEDNEPAESRIRNRRGKNPRRDDEKARVCPN